MICKKKLLSVISQREITSPPIWFMRQAGRYLPEYRQVREKAGSFWNLCLTPELAAEVTLQPLQRFDFDAAIIFSDILIIPHALGQQVSFKPDHGPVLEPINFLALYKNWQEQTYLPHLSPTLNALQRVKQSLSSYHTLIGFSGSPWTLATYMLNARKNHQFDSLPTLLIDQQKEVEALLSCLTDVVATYLIEQLKNGADVIKIFDSWAGAAPRAERTKLLLAPLQKIVTKIRSVVPNAPIIYFGREIADFYPEILTAIPDITLAFDQFVPPVLIRDDFQSKVPVQGNLDPALLVTGGENLDKAVHHLLETLGQGPYIFNLGHGILPQTPLHHVEHVIRLVKNA